MLLKTHTQKVPIIEIIWLIPKWFISVKIIENILHNRAVKIYK